MDVNAFNDAGLDIWDKQLRKAVKDSVLYDLALKNALAGLKSMASKTHGAAMEVEGGVQKYSAGLNSGGKAVAEFAGQFGKAGKVIEYTIKGFLLAAEAVSKHSRRFSSAKF